jgi:hypothetical protein
MRVLTLRFEVTGEFSCFQESSALRKVFEVAQNCGLRLSNHASRMNFKGKTFFGFEA